MQPSINLAYTRNHTLDRFDSNVFHGSPNSACSYYTWILCFPVPAVSQDSGVGSTAPGSPRVAYTSFRAVLPWVLAVLSLDWFLLPCFACLGAKTSGRYTQHWHLWMLGSASSFRVGCTEREILSSDCICKVCIEKLLKVKVVRSLQVVTVVSNTNYGFLAT